MRDTMEQCANCKFFKQETIKQGRCRRYPPVAYTKSYVDTSQDMYRHGKVFNRTDTNFVSVDVSNWCGEWKPKE